MALRSLPRKLSTLGLRSPVGPLMGPVHASSPAAPLMGPVQACSPAAASRRISSHVSPEKYNDPDPRLNKLWEMHDRQVLENEKRHNDLKVMINENSKRADVQVKAIIYAVNGVSAFLVLKHLFSA